jgi:hypothetical protein
MHRDIRELGTHLLGGDRVEHPHDGTDLGQLIKSKELKPAQALAIVPSAAKVAAMGSAIDLPIHHKDAAYVRSHFDAITCVVPDAPRPNEILFALCMSTGGRPHARMGGLEASAITKWDGQR